MYIVINSWLDYTQLSVSSFAVICPSDKFNAHSTAQPSPSPPKFFITINPKIFKNLKYCFIALWR